MSLNAAKFIFCLCVSLCTSCKVNKEHPAEIYRLDKITFITKGIHKKTLYERTLVNNLPNEVLVLDSLIEDYLYTKCFLATDSLVCEDMEINEFYISFFKKTSCTKYYIDHKEDKKHEIYGDGTGRNRDCSEDCFKIFSYSRSIDNPNMWYCNYPKNRKDTILTCEK